MDKHNARFRGCPSACDGLGCSCRQAFGITIEVYDNEKTLDRYAVIIGTEVWQMSNKPDCPDGIAIFCGPSYALNREALGTRLAWSDVPWEVQLAIRKRAMASK